MKSLHLLLALPARPDQIIQCAGHTAPSLIKILQRGQPAAHEPSLAGTLCQACGIKQHQDWPLAPICAAADGIHSAVGTPPGYWLRLDPVHLEVVMGGLILRPPASLQLSQDEARRLIDDINLHWQPEGMKIQATHPTRWYLYLPERPNLHTTPVDQMGGEYLTPHLPRGTDARQFMQRINEVQMLLHSHPINIARENEGRPAVNGLWPWGGGFMPKINPKFDLFAADIFELQALAHQAGRPFIPAPKTLSELPASQHALVALTQPEADWDGDLVARLTQLEENWFQPLMRQMTWGRIGQMRLDLIGHQAVTLSPAKTWRFWR
jgi:hypothetical protein